MDMDFGKYQDKTFIWVMANNIQYFDWALRHVNSFAVCPLLLKQKARELNVYISEKGRRMNYLKNVVYAEQCVKKHGDRLDMSEDVGDYVEDYMIDYDPEGMGDIDMWSDPF